MKGELSYFVDAEWRGRRIDDAGEIAVREFEKKNNRILRRNCDSDEFCDVGMIKTKIIFCR